MSMSACRRPRSLPLLCAALLLLAACPARGPLPEGPRPAAPDGTFTITVLSTNDLHGQLEPLLRYTAEQPPRSYRIAGAEALAAVVAEERAGNPQGTVLLDVGDSLQGSLLSNRFEGAPLHELFAHLGYDATVLGNHEFDFGPVGNPDPPPGPTVDPLGALKAWIAAAPLPLLSANVAAKDGGAAPLAVRQHVLLTRHGVSVAVIGLTTPETATTTMPSFVRALRFAPLLETARRKARALRAAGAEVVLLAVHAGGSCPAGVGSCHGELFDDLLGHLEPGLVDGVVAGHSHQPIALTYRGIPVVEACSRGQVLGRMELVVERRGGRARVTTRRALPARRVCHDRFTRSSDCLDPPAGDAGPLQLDPLLAKHHIVVEGIRLAVGRYRLELGRLGDRVLAHAARPIRHYHGGVSEVGTLYARALLRAAPGADFAVFNAGAVRSDIPRGPITYRHLFESFPFDNRVATVQLGGAEVRQLLQHVYARGYGIALVAGLQVELRCAERYVVTRVTDSAGHGLDPQRRYTVALSDFLLTGGDGLGPVLERVPAERKRLYPDRQLRTAIEEYLRAGDGPLNTTDRPVIAPDHPPVVIAGPPCGADAAPRAPSFCR